jgi:glycosyltransferase involved in cell wall biosynthesis
MTLPPKAVHVPPGSRGIRLDDKPTLSVVVASSREPDKLAACLVALQQQCSDHQAEIVVARTTRCMAIERLAERHPMVHWLVSESAADVTQLRRAGLAAAKGDIVAFVEDDCVVGTDWLERLLPGAAMERRLGRAPGWAAYFAGHETNGKRHGPNGSGAVVHIQVPGQPAAARSAH